MTVIILLYSIDYSTVLTVSALHEDDDVIYIHTSHSMVVLCIYRLPWVIQPYIRKFTFQSDF